MMTNSDSLYALSPSVVATKSNFLVARYSSISLSTIGDFLLLIKSTLDEKTCTDQFIFLVIAHNLLYLLCLAI